MEREDFNAFKSELNIYLDDEETSFVYNFVIDTLVGLKRDQVLLFYGDLNTDKKGLINTINNFIVKNKLTSSKTSIKFLDYLYLTNKKIFENNDKIYNISSVKKIFIFEDDGYTNIDFEIINELLTDPKVICNFICETNKKGRFNSNLLFMPVKLKNNYKESTLEFTCKKCSNKKGIDDFSLFDRQGIPQICFNCDI